MSHISSLDPTRPCVHLCIDVQDPYLQILSPLRRKTFPDKVATFAEALRPYIPTIWIAFGSSSNFITHDKRQPWPTENACLRRQLGWKDKYLVSSLELTHVRPKSDEIIFEKGKVSAFGSSDLHQILPNRAQLIFSGMHTSACVYSSVYHAALRQYDCFVVTDLLADGNLPPNLDASPSCHQDRLIRMLSDCLDSLRFVQAQEVLDHVNSVWPAQPLQKSMRSRHGLFFNPVSVR